MLRLAGYLSFLTLCCTTTALVAKTPRANVCSSDGIPMPTLYGAEIISLSAYERYETTLEVQGTSAMNVSLHFCNVNITYTHPGENDTINVQVWLPVNGWNMNFQGTGGGGYVTGSFDTALAPAVAEGYSAVSTDGGHTALQSLPEYWALASPGNVNQYLLLDFSSVALNDMTVLGKAITESYYGIAPKYSYWNGCSTGGRQGLMMAQRYPGAYDGILADSPAINWGEFIPAEFWGQLVMNQLGYHPLQCELAAFSLAAIQACDSLDGLVDGIIAAPGLCTFDPLSVVGQTFNCSGTMMTYSSQAATVVQKFWQGPRTTDGKFLWYGLNPDASFAGLLNTTCASNGTCSGVPFEISDDWIRYFVEKNPDFDTNAMSYSDYDFIFHQSVTQYDSVIGTDDADLSAFKASGAKMITWHGLADQLIFPNGTIDYYSRVLAGDPGAQDYYRFFEAPGVAHCGGGIGPVPNTAFQSLVEWVESGVAPDALAGTSLPDPLTGQIRSQPLCAYPLVSAYKGGDPTMASSFECAAAFA